MPFVPNVINRLQNFDQYERGMKSWMSEAEWSRAVVWNVKEIIFLLCALLCLSKRQTLFGLALQNRTKMSDIKLYICL